MKRTACYLALFALIALLGWFPFSGQDVVELLPVEVICVQKMQTGIRVLTDTGHQGIGATLSEAFDSLKAGAEKTVFLETADHVLVDFADCDLLRELSGYLRPGCTVCRFTDLPEWESIAQFLKTHSLKMTLQECISSGKTPPYLQMEGENERYAP